MHIDSLTHAFEQAADDDVLEHLGYLIQLKNQRLDELSDEAAELENVLSARPAPASEHGGLVEAGSGHAGLGHAGPVDAGLGRAGRGHAGPGQAGPGDGGEAVRGRTRSARNRGRLIRAHSGQDPDLEATVPRLIQDLAEIDSQRASTASGPSPQDRADRTDQLISHGRPSAYPRLWRRHKTLIAVAAAAAALVAVLVIVLASGGASWPASVATVQSQIETACQNPNLESEPDQVNFACAKDTRQILWVFALLTSENNPRFVDANTHRLGLEPIQPAQGGEIAWSLNLHHPYNPDNPIDSLQVAARAINNIIGGATVTGTNGSSMVEPGLESDPANCLRYTGSARLRSHGGFPSMCARPVTSAAGQAALVADVYKRWIVGASPQASQDAATLYTNSGNPGDTRVQAVLKHLQAHGPRA